MLYLRNTNQVQSLGRDIQRGITNICCTPTLNSVTTASFTELNVNVTFGTYLINCKSCVGGYIQVSEDSGSTWTTINPGNCSPSNLVPMPSQSAYYRAFTSCSSIDQPFDPLTSSFSNEIFFVPNSRLNYSFDERGAEGEFKLIVTGSTLLSTTTDASGTFYEIPSASVVSASVGTISVPTTGSTSMSLWITGSNVSFYTSSCVTQSGSLFIGSYIAIPNEDYYVTASIDHLPSPFPGCGTNNLTYTAESFDPINNRWYAANAQGNYIGQTQYSVVTGSIIASNIETGDCRLNTLYFSGSISIPISNFGGLYNPNVYLGIVSGSFTISGNASGEAWSMQVIASPNSGSVSLFGYNAATPTTTKNSLVGFEVTPSVGPFNARAISLYISGSLIANNPPNWTNGPYSLGDYATISGVGYIRSIGQTNLGAFETQAQQQTYYNCVYGSTPSK